MHLPAHQASHHLHATKSLFSRKLSAYLKSISWLFAARWAL